MNQMLSTDDALAVAKEGMDRFYWWGVPTFFRCPWNEEPAASDIALIGVPHSSGNGSTERDQHLGPRAVRNASMLYRKRHGRFGITPWDLCRINDAGDVPLPEAMVNDACVEHIESFARTFERTGTRLVSIGGDHSITGPLLRAVASSSSPLTNGSPVALVHFDAHTDAYHYLPHFLGNRQSAGHWASYAAAERCIDPHRSIQIGIRPNIAVETRHCSEELGFRILDMEAVEEMSNSAVISAIREQVQDSPVYVTFDLDALDPVDAPAASNLEPGYPGIRISDAVRILQGLRGLNIVGADVVCLVPTKDNPNRITSMNAMVLAFEMVCLMADRVGNDISRASGKGSRK